jgi:hypothetical protein
VKPVTNKQKTKERENLAHLRRYPKWIFEGTQCPDPICIGVVRVTPISPRKPILCVPDENGDFVVGAWICTNPVHAHNGWIPQKEVIYSESEDKAQWV